jgi:hypothetical protein
MFFFHSAITIINEPISASIPPQLTSALWSLFHLWPVKKEEIEAFFKTIAQFTNARSVYSIFYQ